MADEPTLEQIFSDPVGWGYTDGEVERMRADLLIGRAAVLLLNREKPSAAALMRDVQVIEFKTSDLHDYDWMSGEPHVMNAYLDVDPFLRCRFTDARLEEISQALNAIKSRDNVIVD